MNVVVLVGSVVRQPEHRELASGQVIASFDVAVTSVAGPPESVPVAWPDPDGKFALGAGLEVVVVGRVRRRFFRSSGSTQSRTEVVAERVVPSRHKARGRSAVESAVGKLAALTG